jgi:hypothetical protein
VVDCRSTAMSAVCCRVVMSGTPWAVTRTRDAIASQPHRSIRPPERFSPVPDCVRLPRAATTDDGPRTYAVSRLPHHPGACHGPSRHTRHSALRPRISLRSTSRASATSARPRSLAAGGRGTPASSRRIGLFAALVLIGAPDWTRLLVGVRRSSPHPAISRRTCASAPGSGRPGSSTSANWDPTERVQSAADRSRDRARATQIGVASFAIGITVALIAYALPV